MPDPFNPREDIEAQHLRIIDQAFGAPKSPALDPLETQHLDIIDAAFPDQPGATGLEEIPADNALLELQSALPQNPSRPEGNNPLTSIEEGVMQAGLSDVADLPAFSFRADDPEAAQEAYHQTVKSQLDKGVDHVSLPQNASQFISLADKQTLKLFTQVGGGDALEVLNQLEGENPELLDRVRGANLHNLTVFYSEMAPEELSSVGHFAFDRLSELALTAAEGKLESSAGSEREKLVQQISFLREGRARMNEPRIQTYMQRALEKLSRIDEQNASQGTLEDDEGMIIKSLLEVPMQAVPEHRERNKRLFGEHPLTRRFADALTANLKFRDGEGKIAPMPAVRAMKFAFQGALLNHRASRLNIPPEQITNMAPEEMLFHTHPQLMEEVGAAMVDFQTRKEIEGLPEGRRPSTPLQFDMMARDIRARVFPRIAENLMRNSSGPLETLARELEVVDRPELQDIADGVGAALGGIGTMLMGGIRNAGNKLAQTHEFYGLSADARGIVTGEGLFGQFATAHRAALTVGAHMAGKDELVARAALAGAEGRRKIIRPSRLRDVEGRKWIKGIEELVEYETDANGDLRGKLTEAGLREFDPNINALRSLGFLAAEQQSVDLLEQNQRFGFQGTTLNLMRQFIQSQFVSDTIDKSILGLTSREAVQDLDQSVLAASREWDNDPSIKNLLTLTARAGISGMVKMGAEFREGAELLINDPEAFAGIGAITAPIGSVGFKAGRRAFEPVTNRVRKIQTANRLRVAMQNVLRVDPDAPKSLQKTIMRMGEQPGTRAQYRAMQAAADALDYATKNRQDFFARRAGFELPSRDLGIRELRAENTRHFRTASKVTKYLDREGLTELMDDLKLDDLARRWVNKPGFFRSFALDAGKRLGFNVGQRKVRSSLARSTRNLVETLVNDPETNLPDLPVTPELLDEGTFNFWRRLDPTGDLEKGRAVGAAVEWFKDLRDSVLPYRARDAEQYANIEDFTDFAENTIANFKEDLEVQRALARDAGDEETLQELGRLNDVSDNSLQQARNLRQQIEGHSFDEPLQGLAGTPLFRSMSLEHKVAFISQKYGNRYLYERMGRGTETQTDFENRLAGLGKRWTDEPGTTRTEAETFDRELVEEFFETQGLNRYVNDEFNGTVKNTRARRLKEKLGDIDEKIAEVAGRLEGDDLETLERMGARRTELFNILTRIRERPDKMTPEMARAVDSELFAGVHRPDLEESWAKLRQMADTEIKNSPLVSKNGTLIHANLTEIGQQVNDGNLGRAISAVKSAGLGMRMNIQNFFTKTEILERGLDSMTPAQRDLFDVAMIIQRNERVAGHIDVLREKFPALFSKIDPKTPAEAVNGLLDDFDGLRKDLVRTLFDAGMIPKGIYDSWMKPWATRHFSAYEVPRLFGDQQVDLWTRRLPGSGINLGFLESQRHATRFAANVYPPNGRPIQRHFDSFDEARDYLEREFNVTGELSEVDDMMAKTLEGATPIGNRAVIMSPLGERSELLGELGNAGSATLRRLGEVFQTMMRRRFLEGFDRDGLALAPDEFDGFLQTREGARARPKWTQVPDGREWGALEGKWIPKRLARHIRAFDDGHQIMATTGDILQEKMLEWGKAGEFVSGGIIAPISGLNNLVKAGIKTSQIVLSPATILANVMGDTFFFARAAAGAEVNFGISGVRTSIQSANFLRDLRTGRLRTSELPEPIREALERGVLDEQFYGRAGFSRSKEQELLFGFDGFGAMLAPARELRDLAVRANTLERITKSPDWETTPGADKARIVEELTTLEDLMGKRQERAMRAQANAMDVIARAPARKTREYLQAAKTFYGDLGNWNRLRVYLHLREKGMDADDASARVNTFMQTYSRIPNAVRGLSRSFLGSPILSFPYELGRITANVMRHNPGLMAGIAMGTVGRNMVASLAGGVNPYQAFNELRREGTPFKGLMMMMSRQLIPTGNGQYNWVQIPGLQIYEHALSNFGTMRGLTEVWDGPTQDLPGKALGVLAGVAGKVIGSPMFNFGASMMTGLDPITGEQHDDATELLGRNMEGMLRAAVPPWTPVVGSISDRVQRAVEGGRVGYGARRISALQAMFQGFTGFRIRGDISSLIPDSLEPLAARFAKAGVLLANLQPTEDMSVLVGENRPLGIRDYYSTVRGMTSVLDKFGGRDWVNEFDQAHRDMRGGISNGGEAGDRQVREAAEDMRQKYDMDIDLGGINIQLPFSDRKLIQRYVNAQDRVDEKLMMEDMSTLRRTTLLALMANSGNVKESREFTDRLLQQYTFSSTYDLRGPTNPDELKVSLGIVEEALRNPPPFQYAKPLEQARTYLQFWLQNAEVDDQIKRITDPKWRDAVEELDRIGIELGDIQ